MAKDIITTSRAAMLNSRTLKLKKEALWSKKLRISTERSSLCTTDKMLRRIMFMSRRTLRELQRLSRKQRWKLMRTLIWKSHLPMREKNQMMTLTHHKNLWSKRDQETLTLLTLPIIWIMNKELRNHKTLILKSQMTPSLLPNCLRIKRMLKNKL